MGGQTGYVCYTRMMGADQIVRMGLDGSNNTILVADMGANRSALPSVPTTPWRAEWWLTAYVFAPSRGDERIHPGDAWR